MKKYLVLIIVMILFTSCGKNPLITILNSEQSSSTTLLYENFDSYSVGNFTSLTGGWTFVSSSSASYSIDNNIFKSGDKSLKICKINSGLGSEYIYKMIFFTKQVIYTEMYIYLTKETTSAHLVLGIGNDQMSQVALLFSNDPSSNKFTVNLFEPSLQTISTGVQATLNTWHKIKIKIDTSNKLWELWINDSQPAIGGSGKYEYGSSFSGGVNRVVLQIGLLQGEINMPIYFDEIKVTCP